MFKKLLLWFLLSFVIVGTIGILWVGYYLGWVAGSIFGIRIGLEVAVPVTFFAWVFLKARKSVVPSGDIVARVQANLFRGVEGVGGHLTITKKELIFEPHVFNVQNQIGNIPLPEIENISKKNTLGFIPNGMIVKTRDGKQYQFVLWHRNKTINLIKGLAQSNIVSQAVG